MGSAGAARPLILPSIVVGVGLSGFFDGILLHQVLQWHHLLSLVPGETYCDIGTQILADGLFHVLMYLVTASGLLLLWLRRGQLREADASAAIAGGGLLGFGAWNIADVALFHWVLGIHRIRINVENPLAYDIGWLVILGLLPAVLGYVSIRRPANRGGRRGRIAGAMVALLAVGGGLWASVPPEGQTTTVVLVAPERSIEVMNAAFASGAKLHWLDGQRGLLLLAEGEADLDGALYRSGAFLVTRSPALAGCALATV